MKNQSSVTTIVQAAMIAALYVTLTFLANALGLANHAIQVRFSEALTILPVFTPAAVPGLFIGCLIGNILGGAILPDIIFGSIATLLGALFTYKLFGNRPLLAPLPPIIANTLIVPLVLRFGYGVALPIPFMMLTVGIGEVLSCGVLGLALYYALKKYKNIVFLPAKN